jgi:L-arabinose isomerase
MNQEIETYFAEQYKKAKFTVVPGHWPDFKSKEEVDKWIEDGNNCISVSNNWRKKPDGK